MTGNASAERRRGSPDEGLGANLLTDYLRRLDRIGVQGLAVHVDAPGIRAEWRGPLLTNLAMRPLVDLAISRGAPCFPLSPQACVAVCNNLEPAEVNAVLNDGVPAGGSDPLLAMAPFRLRLRWFDISREDERLALLALARAHAASATGQAQAHETDASTSPVPGQPLDARSLATISEKLATCQITEYLQHQNALALGDGKAFSPLFREVFVAINELQHRLAPGFNLFSRPALFRYLTETLDGLVLKAVSSGLISGAGLPLSINLNIRSIRSAKFARFVAERDRGFPLIVEVQVTDILAHPQAFAEASRILRDAGCRLLIDGVTPLSLAFFDAGSIPCDYLKIAWHAPDVVVAVAARHNDLAARIKRIGAERIIFTRVETLDAVRAALQLGVKQLQGRFIDRLILALRAPSDE